MYKLDLLLLLFVFLISRVADRMGISQLFQIVPSTCTNEQIFLVDRWLDETLAVVQAAQVSLTDAKKGDASAVSALLGFWTIMPRVDDENLQKITRNEHQSPHPLASIH